MVRLKAAVIFLEGVFHHPQTTDSDFGPYSVSGLVLNERINLGNSGCFASDKKYENLPHPFSGL